jgi:hypothetical protein
MISFKQYKRDLDKYARSYYGISREELVNDKQLIAGFNANQDPQDLIKERGGALDLVVMEEKKVSIEVFP